MARYLNRRIGVRVPQSLHDQLTKGAAAEGVDLSIFVRDLLSMAIRRKMGAHVTDPLIEALHTVLPRYMQPLHDFVAATRFDAVVAREMAAAAALAAMLATGRSQNEARELVHTTMSRAVKVAGRRVRERPELNGDESAAGGS